MHAAAHCGSAACFFGVLVAVTGQDEGLGCEAVWHSALGAAGSWGGKIAAT